MYLVQSKEANEIMSYHWKSEYNNVQTSTCANLLIKLWGYSVVIDRIKCFLSHRRARLKIKAPSLRRKVKTTTYSILLLYILIIIQHIDKAASHQLLYENSISYVKSFSNTIIYDGNKDSYICNGSVLSSKAHSLRCSIS